MIKLPIDQFIICSNACKTMNRMQMHRLLIGWGIEGICCKNDTISLYNRKKYLEVDRRRGPLYCMFDYTEQLAKIIGDYTIWDHYETQYHDFVYHLLKKLEKPWFTKFPLHQSEYRRLKYNSIPQHYHVRIINSIQLKALLL